ncbi:MAG TPA: hypothetical protein VN031_02600 [Candidatus Microsaccharimonas sp.]|nr:hypothetical protein [Candidatus Microsaccharimonas sp.]
MADGSCISGGFCTNLPHATASSSTLHHVLQIVIGTFAVVAVLMIVIAGLNIVTAGGDSAKVAKARGTIIFALVGLAIAIFADVIVSMVAGRL